MDEVKIKKIIGREVLDSRGNPTVEAEVILQDNSCGRAIVASGASTGKYEALELRDHDMQRYHGQGVEKAIHNIESLIYPALKELEIHHIFDVDKKMIQLDGTSNSSKLGANAILAVSMAFYKAVSQHYHLPLYRLFGGLQCLKTPMPMLNILNGGAHANNNLDIQEFMIVPYGFGSFKEAIRASSEVYHSLKSILKEKNYITSVGDEGGFAPMLSSHEEALDLIVSAINKAHYHPGQDFYIALDAASSEWKGKEIGTYYLPKSKKEYTSDTLIEYWESLCKDYPICSIEDGLDEDDQQGWIKMTQKLKNKILLVGDDLFVTNPKRLKEGIEKNIANAILIKPNQIGTIYETILTIQMAKKANYKVILSHRSGESEDTTIASLAVGMQAELIKSGASCRSERVAKYNELIRIEESL